MNAANPMHLTLTKKTHSCIRLEKDGRTLVIDPGAFSEQDAAVGADAILVTHEHPDHFDEGRLRAASRPTRPPRSGPCAASPTGCPRPSPAASTPSGTATPSPRRASTYRCTANCTR